MSRGYLELEAMERLVAGGLASREVAGRLEQKNTEDWLFKSGFWEREEAISLDP